MIDNFHCPNLRKSQCSYLLFSWYLLLEPLHSCEPIVFYFFVFVERKASSRIDSTNVDFIYFPNDTLDFE